jgi:hypothetical protein
MLGVAGSSRSEGWAVTFNDHGQSRRAMIPHTELTMFPHIVVADDDTSFRPRFPPPPEVEVGRLRQDLMARYSMYAPMQGQH